MAITALLELTLKPEAVAGSAEVMRTVLTQTRSRPGNLGIEVLIDQKDETHVMVIEHWASMEDDAAYRTWRATPEGASDLGALLAARPTLTHYDDSGI